MGPQGAANAKHSEPPPHVKGSQRMVAPNAVLKTEKHLGSGVGGGLQCHKKTEYLPESPYWECVHRTETGTWVYTAYEQGGSLRSSSAKVEMPQVSMERRTDKPLRGGHWNAALAVGRERPGQEGPCEPEAPIVQEGEAENG